MGTARHAAREARDLAFDPTNKPNAMRYWSARSSFAMMLRVSFCSSWMRHSTISSRQ